MELGAGGNLLFISDLGNDSLRRCLEEGEGVSFRHLEQAEFKVPISEAGLLLLFEVQQGGWHGQSRENKGREGQEPGEKPQVGASGGLWGIGGVHTAE